MSVEVTILLATLNGEATLKDQLQSFLNQTHRSWHLVASDDGSNDRTAQLLEGFAAATGGRSVELHMGPRRGFARNFLHLLCVAKASSGFAALSDQDDVWLPQKLSRALAALEMAPEDRPALYCGRTWICDSSLRPLAKSPSFSRPPDFRNALVQSIAGGNTMVLNNKAFQLARSAAAEAGEVTSHDWWLYQIVTGAGGTVIYDDEPMVLYRQHSGNQIGSNHSVRARAKRLRQLVSGRFRDWNSTNLEALVRSSHRFTDENRALLALFAESRGASLGKRLRALRHSGLYRQTRAGSASLWAATALGLV